ncbi:MAG: hypothetical protein M1814_004187 [Vezdaea aestivalis]|nr:MAG: hypothetical protein M1814_004187 [Vezdaea aestivalis]
MAQPHPHGPPPPGLNFPTMPMPGMAQSQMPFPLNVNKGFGLSPFDSPLPSGMPPGPLPNMGNEEGHLEGFLLRKADSRGTDKQSWARFTVTQLSFSFEGLQELVSDQQRSQSRSLVTRCNDLADKPRQAVEETIAGWNSKETTPNARWVLAYLKREREVLGVNMLRQKIWSNKTNTIEIILERRTNQSPSQRRKSQSIGTRPDFSKAPIERHGGMSAQVPVDSAHLPQRPPQSNMMPGPKPSFMGNPNMPANQGPPRQQQSAGGPGPRQAQEGFPQPFKGPPGGPGNLKPQTVGGPGNMKPQPAGVPKSNPSMGGPQVSFNDTASLRPQQNGNPGQKKPTIVQASGARQVPQAQPRNLQNAPPKVSQATNGRPKPSGPASDSYDDSGSDDNDRYSDDDESDEPRRGFQGGIRGGHGGSSRQPSTDPSRGSGRQQYMNGGTFIEPNRNRPSQKYSIPRHRHLTKDDAVPAQRYGSPYQGNPRVVSSFTQGGYNDGYSQNAPMNYPRAYHDSRSEYPRANSFLMEDEFGDFQRDSYVNGPGFRGGPAEGAFGAYPVPRRNSFAGGRLPNHDFQRSNQNPGDVLMARQRHYGERLKYPLDHEIRQGFSQMSVKDDAARQHMRRADRDHYNRPW